ncbi:hypothetical protein PABG_00777 [Paracoccidioides brasiliensis Pb03]|nr:hypothetical protein PABG_00777 [Paracoccidioides brasiliensis Pb03]
MPPSPSRRTKPHHRSARSPQTPLAKLTQQLVQLATCKSPKRIESTEVGPVEIYGNHGSTHAGRVEGDSTHMSDLDWDVALAELLRQLQRPFGGGDNDRLAVLFLCA